MPGANLKSVIRLLIAIISFGITNLSFSQTLDSYPKGPIKIIVPYSAGAVTDALGRIIAMGLNESFGVTVLVENKVGAGGTIGTEQVALSPHPMDTLCDWVQPVLFQLAKPYILNYAMILRKI
ncbi:tripartite tricarboxylate transporter substrate-binding protein [Polynucleobacter necessarius]|uniref:tripartite tricarboxylate transporter substrate-binding protein n=1 Tax=Polynucleobacter necessarius TaxID=576610 RepID=UPI000E0946CD|nr:tripartite tricarboxylate transporter substrate-binding protein [Polynucleobacter necessarius]HAT39633.1 hypothetical protein [Polynucleobacter sp.]